MFTSRGVNPAQAQPPADARFSLAERLVLFGLILYLTMPASLLVTLGIPYNIPGGFLPFKFHPASYLIGLAFVLFAQDPLERPRLAEAIRALPILAWFPLVLMVVMVYITWRFGTSGVGFFIDTFFIAALLGPILVTRSTRFNRGLFLWVLILQTLGSLLALIESATQWRLLPYLLEGEPAMEDFFRSTGLAAHPLEGAQRTIVVLFAAWVLPWRYRVPVMLTLFLSLLAHGSRSAFALASIFLLVSGITLLIQAIRDARINPHWLLIGLLIATILVGGSAVLVWYLDLGTRIFEKLYLDESALSRLHSIQLIEELDPEQFWLGAGADGVTALLLARRGWFNIENFWVVLLLQLGLFLFLFLASALLWFLYRLAWRGPLAVRMAALVYLLAASTNDALSHKTPNLVIVVATLVGASAFMRVKPQEPVRSFSESAAVLRRLRQPPPADGGG